MKGTGKMKFSDYNGAKGHVADSLGEFAYDYTDDDYRELVDLYFYTDTIKGQYFYISKDNVDYWGLLQEFDSNRAINH